MIKKIKHEVINDYVYEVTDSKNSRFGKIFIRFVNGKFKNAEYPFHGNYTREEWKILSQIEKEISKIEKKLNENK